MGEIRSQDKRDKLRLLFEDSKNGGLPLQAALMAMLRAADTALTGGATPGTILTSTSEGGGSAGFQSLSFMGGLSPENAKRLLGELLDLFDAAVAHLGVGITGTDDAVIYAQMMGQNPTGPGLRTIRKFRQDYTGLRYGVGYYLGTG